MKTKAITWLVEVFVSLTWRMMGSASGSRRLPPVTNPWQHPKFSHRIFSEVTCRENFILPRKGVALLCGKNATRSHIKEEVGLALY